MTREKFEEAKTVLEHIGYGKEMIGILDTMIAHFHDNVHYDIRVVCTNGPCGFERSIRHSDLPELRDALKEARERISHDLRKNEEKLQKL